MSGHKLFKLRWKKKDFNNKPFPYSLYRKEYEEKLEEFRGPDGYPYLIPSLKDTSTYARRYRDQVKKIEIERIQNLHLKMLEFRKNADKRHNIKTSEQTLNSLPYWLFATRTKLFRGLPLSVQNAAVSSFTSDCVDTLNEVVSNSVREYLLPNSPFRETHDDRTNKHLNNFLKTLAFTLTHNSQLRKMMKPRNFFVNQDVETHGFFGKDDKIYQVFDNAAVAQLRSREPLIPLIEQVDSQLCQYSEDEIPEIPHNLDYYEVFVWENKKYKMPRRQQQWIKKRIEVVDPIGDADIFSGVKPGSKFPFIHTQFLLLPRSQVFWRETSEFYHQQVNDCKSLLNLFSVTSSTAWYLRYTPFQDLTVPLNCNGVSFDGQNITFYMYQLNTIALGKFMLDEYVPEHDNPRANILWSTESVPLYTFNKDTGSIDVNTDAVRILATLITRNTSAQEFQLPESSWDEMVPRGIPLVRIDRDVDPGKIWIKPRKYETWPKEWYNPKYKWNPVYTEKLEKEGNETGYYESDEDHSKFIDGQKKKKNLL